jgi:hypothetical protein
MGEMADWINEQGADEYDAHLRGDCEYGCPYCAVKTKRVKGKRTQKGDA